METVYYIFLLLFFLFQKPAFERVWKLRNRLRRDAAWRFRSLHLSGYGNVISTHMLNLSDLFQKPAFEWVWKHFSWLDKVVYMAVFQKPAFERVWKHIKSLRRGKDDGVSETRI